MSETFKSSQIQDPKSFSVNLEAAEPVYRSPDRSFSIFQDGDLPYVRVKYRSGWPISIEIMEYGHA